MSFSSLVSSIVIGAFATHSSLTAGHTKEMDDLMTEFLQPLSALSSLHSSIDIPANLAREASVCGALSIIGTANFETMKSEKGHKTAQFMYLKAILPHITSVCDEVDNDLARYQKPGHDEIDDLHIEELFKDAAKGEYLVL